MDPVGHETRSRQLAVVSRPWPVEPGITVEQARAAFDVMTRALPDGPPADRSTWLIGILPLKELLVGDIRRPLQVFAGAVLLVLLIACANVANLLLARASGRSARLLCAQRSERAGRGWCVNC